MLWGKVPGSCKETEEEESDTLRKGSSELQWEKRAQQLSSCLSVLIHALVLVQAFKLIDVLTIRQTSAIAECNTSWTYYSLFNITPPGLTTVCSI
jgi:hypothetical protein